MSHSALITIDKDLVLHPAQPSDAPDLFALIDQGRLYLREWLPFIDHSFSASDTALYLRSVSTPGNLHDQVYTIRYQGRVAGIIGYKDIDRINNKLEIGYWLGELFQGRGIMLRSCRALVAHAFAKMNMNRVQVRVAVGNNKSKRIPRQLGFTLEGTMREGEWLRGRFVDLEVYSLLKREWPRASGESDPS